MAASPALPCRMIKRSLLDTRWASRPLLRTITTATTQHTTTADTIPETLLRPRAHPIPERDLPTTPKAPFQPATSPKRKRRGPPPPPAPVSPVPRSSPPRPEIQHTDASLDPSVHQLLPLLKSQPPHYLRMHIHGKPYLVTQGDTVRLPFLMHGVQPGDVLRLNRASLLGSRDYTLKAGAPAAAESMGYIDERLFTCRARVMGVEVEPLRIKEKTKRRQRHVRHVKSKHRYTVLRVMEIAVNEAPEGQVVDGGVQQLTEQTAKVAL